MQERLREEMEKALDRYLGTVHPRPKLSAARRRRIIRGMAREEIRFRRMCREATEQALQTINETFKAFMPPPKESK